MCLLSKLFSVQGFFTHNELGQILSDKAKHILEKNGFKWAKPESTVAVQLALTINSLAEFEEKKDNLRGKLFFRLYAICQLLMPPPRILMYSEYCERAWS